MTLQDRIEALTALGEYLQSRDERLLAHAHRASVDNLWFTQEFMSYALDQAGQKMLHKTALEQWSKNTKAPVNPQRVGLILAGNIPLVGLHDILSVFVSGNISVIKLSEKDKILVPFLLKVLGELDPRTSAYFEMVEKLKDFDAVIATGSNNSARYFEYYFAKYPHIIRRNRNAVALLDGTETEDQLSGLSDDIFMYFGLGCRSVSHLFLPKGYDFTPLVGQINRYAHLANHSKYKNNLDYNMALHILNKMPTIAISNLILLEAPALISPVSCLNYSYYDDINTFSAELKTKSEEIQCVVSNHDITGLSCVRFGQAQQPALDDYADGIDTLAFLQTLSG